MNIKNIVLIGAGKLGSRHLQALANVKNTINIQVIDPSVVSLAVAKERFEQMPPSSAIRDISYSKEINEVNSGIDVAIIATSSNVRRGIVEYLIKQKKVKYLILEKVVFQSYKDFMDIKELLKLHDVKAWVNCGRRMFSFYQKVRQDLVDAAFIDLTVKGAQWGLGCNAIHMIDLYAFISNQANFALDDHCLDVGWIDSKRNGFCEFTGTLQGKSDVGEIRLTSYALGNMPCTVEIVSDKFRYIVFEAKGKALTSREEHDWKWEECDFDLKYQSQLTNIVVDDLLDKGTCELTAYKESMLLHKELLAAFLRHMNKSSEKEIEQCPIT